MSDIEVLTPDADALHPDSPHHSADGRFLPGNQAGVGHGRPSRARETAVLDAIRSAYSPEEIVTKLKKAMEIAEETKSARGMIACLDFIADRLLGKPPVRVATVNSNFQDLMAFVQTATDEQFTQVVDAWKK